MKIFKYNIADTFTSNPMEGNPVAIFTDARGIDIKDMQRIAKEMNLSETTFIFPPCRGGDARLRIFTPVNELPFAEHSTLGAAMVLGELAKKNHLNLETTMGIIPFSLKHAIDGHVLSAEMEQPIPTYEKYVEAPTVLKALRLTKSILPIEIYSNGTRHVFVGLPSVAELSSLVPNFTILAKLSNVAINCFAWNQTHWQIRMFTPAYGIVKHAAAGSAAGLLAWHLARHGKIKIGEWIGIQQGVEMERSSIISARVKSLESKVTSVSGSAVIIARGDFLLAHKSDRFKEVFKKVD